MTRKKLSRLYWEKLGDNFHYLGPDELSKFWKEEYEAHKELGKVFKKN